MDDKKKENWIEKQKDIYPNPDCQYCNNYERLRDKLRIAWIIFIILGSSYYIYNTHDDIKSQCCQEAKRLGKIVSEINDPTQKLMINKNFLEDNNTIKNETYKKINLNISLTD